MHSTMAWGQRPAYSRGVHTDSKDDLKNTIGKSRLTQLVSVFYFSKEIEKCLDKKSLFTTLTYSDIFPITLTAKTLEFTKGKLQKAQTDQPNKIEFRPHQ